MHFHTPLSKDTHPDRSNPFYNASIMASRPRPAPTEMLTAMLVAAPVLVADGVALLVPLAFTPESEPDEEAEPESEPAVNYISALFHMYGIWKNSLPVGEEVAPAAEVSSAVVWVTAAVAQD